MTERQAIGNYLEKARESLAGAGSELANRRFNNCANRSYYACFQAAIAALLAAGIQARSPGGRWRHEYVQAQFTGQLINRQRRYPPALRTVLSETMLLRQEADYELDGISQRQATRALRRSREFENAVQRENGETQ